MPHAGMWTPLQPLNVTRSHTASSQPDSREQIGVEWLQAGDRGQDRVDRRPRSRKQASVAALESVRDRIADLGGLSPALLSEEARLGCSVARPS